MSSSLGELNRARYASWQLPFNRDNARPAIFTFTGDVYQGLKAGEFSSADLNYAQQHLRILSGLYGILRPLDLMQPYRLEMGTSLANSRGKDLYRFWGDRLTLALQQDLEGKKNPLLINLASNEYFSAIQPDLLGATVVAPAFKDYSNGKYRFLSYFAKQARGMMAAWLIRNRVRTAGRIRDFDVAGYRYSEAESTPATPVFLRRKPA